MIDFNQLSTLTLTSLILAISFTVLAIAGIFFIIYKKDSLKNAVVKFICVAALPFVALSMWFLAVLSITDTFANEEALAIVISMAIGAAIVAIVYFIAKAIEDYNSKKANKDVKETKTDKAEIVNDISKVEEDLTNLKEIINDVIEEPKNEQVKEEVKEEVKTEEVIKTEATPIEEIKEDVKEEATTAEVTPVEENIEETENKNQITFDDIIEELVKENTNVVIEPKPVVEEAKEEPKTENVTVEVITEEVSEGKVEEVKPEPKKRGRKPKAKVEESKAEEIVTSKTDTVEKNKVESTQKEKKDEKTEEESDFIKSLNEILGQLENGSKN